MELVTKEVWFERYCMDCTHYLVDETDEPCNECLTNPMREYSHKPIKFEPKEDK